MRKLKIEDVQKALGEELTALVQMNVGTSGIIVRGKKYIIPEKFNRIKYILVEQLEGRYVPKDQGGELGAHFVIPKLDQIENSKDTPKLQADEAKLKDALKFANAIEHQIGTIKEKLGLNILEAQVKLLKEKLMELQEGG